MKKNALIFCAGGTIYPILEILCRGKTDFSMAIAGGTCLCLIDKVCNIRLQTRPLAEKCLAGSAIITTVEFCVGVVVNLILKMNVWDYSQEPANILGQICIPFSLLWFFITIPAMGLCNACGKLADKVNFRSLSRATEKLQPLFQVKKITNGKI